MVELAGAVWKGLGWFLIGLLEICGLSDQSRKGVRDDEVADELALQHHVETDSHSLSLTKEQVDTIRQSSVRVVAKRKADET
jgi:hypothetical protein